MKTFLILTILLSLSFLWANTVPVVEITSVVQRQDGSRLVDIIYNLTDADGDEMYVTLQVSSDGGSTYSLTCTQVTGDVGIDVLSGNGKQIVWDAGIELPNVQGDNFFFKVIAEDMYVVDIDGNVYRTVQIGNQVWMAENLKVTRYRNGDLIPTGHSNSAWTGLSTGAQCVYNNNASNELDTYGRLYNWYAVVDSRGLATEGWRVPSDDDIKQLEMALGMTQVEADAEGYRGTNQGSHLAGRVDLWYDGALDSNPQFGASGFNFLPGGGREWANEGSFVWATISGYFWSSTEYDNSNGRYRNLAFDFTTVNRSCSYKPDGYSVRCVRSVELQ